MKQAPFLMEVTLADPDLDPDLGHDPDVSDRNRAGQADDEDWDPEDFPAWYRDKVAADETHSHQPGGSDSSSNHNHNHNNESRDDQASSDYPFDLAAVQTLDRLNFGAVTVLVGDNGSGKSTIVEAIAVAAGFNPEGGSRNLNFTTYDTHSTLHQRLVLRWNTRPRWGWFLRAETFYGMASHIAQDDDPAAGLAHIFPDLHNRSHGESFLALAESRFTGRGLYLFDEPESALSIHGLMRLSALIQRSLAKGSQFIISTHSPLLTGIPGAVVYQLDADAGIEPTTFDDLPSTELWRQFLADPASFHRNLESTATADRSA